MFGAMYNLDSFRVLWTLIESTDTLRDDMIMINFVIKPNEGIRHTSNRRCFSTLWRQRNGYCVFENAPSPLIFLFYLFLGNFSRTLAPSHFPLGSS